ncbi:MAG: TIGR00153 family protein [Gammaproteobacteria bacterium]|nr:TIGR00153 family protein [Gammaproteobacteria bacterium]
MPLNNIMGIFAKSPIKPLEEHIKRVHSCCEELLPFFAAAQKGDWQEAATIRQRICQMEREADTIKREIRLSLPSSIFMPVDRGNLLELLRQQDKIANRAKDISGRVLGRELPIPTLIAEDLQAYLARTLDAVRLARSAVNELDDLLETGFRGREAVIVEKMVKELDHIEDDTDGMQVALHRKLRQCEAELSAVDVVFLYSVIEWIGDLSDLAARVGARLELMLARS